jgi:hypothetical protein
MPHLTLPVDPDGLVLNVMVGLPGKATAALLAAGQAIPRPLLLRGQIDNGSDITCIAARVVQHFGLPIIQTTTSHTTGGMIQVNLFEISFSIPQQGTLSGPLLVLEHLPVMEWANPPANIEVLAGLDVLKHLLMIHDGQRDEFTLSD